MWSHLDLEKWLQWAKVAYMVSVGVAAAATFAIYHLSAWVTADKERELEKYQNESQIQIAGAEERAAEANAVASKAQLELARLKKPRTIAPEDLGKVRYPQSNFGWARMSRGGNRQWLSGKR